MEGRLVLYRRSQFGHVPELRAFRAEFADRPAIVREMVRRRDLLLRALESDDPSMLPRCEWFERGCDYAECCGCERAVCETRIVGEDAVTLTDDAELCALLVSRVRQAGTSNSNGGFKLNDLVFTRKAALERLHPREEDEPDNSDLSTLGDLERMGTRGAPTMHCVMGHKAFGRRQVSLRSLSGWVATYRGVPTLLRTSKFTSMIERQKLAATLTHQFDRLGFECALAGADQGRLVLCYECIPGDKFMVYDVWFKDLSTMLVEAERRFTMLEERADPQQLPACPAWMARFCRFAATCGCGGQQIASKVA